MNRFLHTLTRGTRMIFIAFLRPKEAKKNNMSLSFFFVYLIVFVHKNHT